MRASTLQQHSLPCSKSRESDDPKSFCPTRANGLVEIVNNAIHEKCRIVNQVGLKHCVKNTWQLSVINFMRPMDCTVLQYSEMDSIS